jgi:hypothetical protein
MREVVPGIGVAAIVLADRTPLPFTQIRPPLPPENSGCAEFLKPAHFRVAPHVRNLRCDDSTIG